MTLSLGMRTKLSHQEERIYENDHLRLHFLSSIAGAFELFYFFVWTGKLLQPI